MNRAFVVAGTDTNVGKTVFAAALAGALGASYWKPIQAGLEDGGDSEIVHGLSGLPPSHILPEVYRLTTPASPHRAAELDGIEIDPARLVPPPGLGTPLVIELAGGLLVPITRRMLQIEMVAAWQLPVILCARTALGTINHSILSIEALRRRGISIHGIAFIGEVNDDAERTICEMGSVRRLGRLPVVAPLDRERLAAVFAANFAVGDFV